VTFVFWIYQDLGDHARRDRWGRPVDVTFKLGYAISTGIFFAIFLVTAIAQVSARSYHRFLYWAVIVATTTVGTTMSDYLTRTAGLGYLYSSLLGERTSWRFVELLTQAAVHRCLTLSKARADGAMGFRHQFQVRGYGCANDDCARLVRPAPQVWISGRQIQLVRKLTA
jgi:hypothetical protein